MSLLSPSIFSYLYPKSSAFLLSCLLFSQHFSFPFFLFSLLPLFSIFLFLLLIFLFSFLLFLLLIFTFFTFISLFSFPSFFMSHLPCLAFTPLFLPSSLFIPPPFNSYENKTTRELRKSSAAIKETSLGKHSLWTMFGSLRILIRHLGTEPRIYLGEGQKKRKPNMWGGRLFDCCCH